MTLLQDLLLTSRTVYEREKEFLISEMTREARNLVGMLREHSNDAELLRQGQERSTYWRRFLSDLQGERQRRDQAIREFCKRAEGHHVHARTIVEAAA
jgi:hypothetical protein